MKWWAIIRIRSTREVGLKPGEYTTIFDVGPVRVLREVVENDVQSHKSVEAGNFWLRERVGCEWEKGNWKWDPRWK